MSCISPLTLRVDNKNILVSCNHCINCLIAKQSALEFLCKKELLEVYKSGQGASFVTLTYNDSNVPLNSNGHFTLRKSHLQKFMKRIRRNMEYYGDHRKFKYIACGEYGDFFGRCHFHICYLGLSDSDMIKYSRKCWKYGLVDVGCLSAGGIRYVLNYMQKSSKDSNVKILRDSEDVESPFLIHSVGLGKKWILSHYDDIVESRFTFNNNGKINLFPKYVMRAVSCLTGVDYRPYVTDFLIHSDDYNYTVANSLDYSSYMNEKSYISYRYKVDSLRSKNMPITDKTLNKAYIRPKTKRINYVDEYVDSLSTLAMSYSVC